MKKSFSNLLLVFFIPFFFFLPQLIFGKIPIPADSILNLYHPFRDLEIEGHNAERFPAKNPFINDPVLQTYEWRNLVINNFKNHKWPLWNPNSFSGTPLLANLQSSPFQILNVSFFILPIKIAWGISVILPSIFISVFMYFFLKELKIISIAAVYGAIILPFSGFFMPWMTWGTIIPTAMWLPLILLSILKIQPKISASWFLILNFSITQTIFSGHAQTALYVFVSTFLFLIYNQFLKRNSKSLAVIVIAIFLGFLITAVQLIPFWEFAKLSAREIDQGYFAGRQDWFLPVQNLIQLISPDFFGNPATNNYWGVWNYWEFVSYIGIIPLSFALLAFFKKSSHQPFFIALAAFSLGLALENPISKIPYVLNLPVVSTMQPSRIIFLLVFSLVTLSAIGFHQFLKEKKERLFHTPFAILVVLITLALSTFILKEFYPTGSSASAKLIAQRNLILPIMSTLVLIITLFLKRFRVSEKIIIALILTLTIFELFRFSYKFTPFSKLSWIFPQTKILEYLENQPKPFRVMTTDRRVFHPNISSAYGIESVDGYDPIYLESYAKLVSVWQSSNPNAPVSSFNRIVTPQNISSPITNLLNVKYILTLDEIINPDLVKVIEEGQTKLYLNTKVQSRFFLANEVLKVNSDQEELSLLLSQNFSQKSATSQEFEFQKQEVNGSVNIERYEDQSILITVKTDKPSAFVSSTPFYPGWHAYIDNKKSEIKKTDFMFQSVIVPQGSHSVEFKFEPQSFYNGLILSGVGIVLTLLTAVTIWKRKYQ